MKYILSRDYRLRGWKGEPFFLERFSSRLPQQLTRDQFALLLQCDGRTEINPDAWAEMIAHYTEENIVQHCPEGGSLLPEQAYRLFPNRRLEAVDLSITGKCNLNCKHCFNARDFSLRTTEPTLKQLIGVLDQLDECGVGHIRVNGGEPLVHKDFLAFTAEVARRGIKIPSLLTNGYLLTPELLDEIERQGHRPLWCVSFDGLGFHNWLRGAPDAEEKTLAAIKLLCSRGHAVQAAQVVWKDSVASLKPTALKLQELGVSIHRIIRITPSIRWKMAAPDQMLAAEELIPHLPEFLTWWNENRIDMNLVFWSYLTQPRGLKNLQILPDLQSSFRDNNSAVCSSLRRRPYIGADGNVLPCMSLPGFKEFPGLDYGNLYKGGSLQRLFTNSPFLSQISLTCAQLKEMNEKCHTCRWRDRCSMGCPAVAMVRNNGNMNGVDPTMCFFYESGTYEKLIEVAERFGLKHNCMPL